MKTALFTTLVLLLFLPAVAQPRKGYAIGDIVPPFSLKNIDGKMVALNDYEGAKGFIVVFTCNECPIAKAYQNRIIALDQKYAPMGYPVIAVNANDPVAQPADTYEKMQARAKEKGFTFPYLVDPDQIVTKQFGATNTPHSFILQRNNEGYVVRYAGAIDNDTEDKDPGRNKYVEDAINALLSNKEIAVTKTKAIGCGIKWKKS